jgi:phosphoribosylglycinamide formyltransferase 1
MKIGILISGRGSNMVALVDAVQRGEIPDSEVSVVISNKADAAGLEKARERGVETIVIEQNGRTRLDHDAEIISELNKRGVELVCLAGYMRLLSPDFIRAFPNKIINIHPSLLPAFPGLDAQKQAFDAGVKITGCTVHYVDELLDHGPIILQQWVSVEKGDDVPSLSDRVLTIEHKLYVEAVRYLAFEYMTKRGKTRPKYKVLKSFAHNFTHSFVSFNNYIDEGYVIDDLRKIVRECTDHRITINWVPSNLIDQALTPRIEKSIQAYQNSLIRHIHQAGARLCSIREFRTDIFLLRNHQMAVNGVITDDRGRTYTVSVTDF